jgi:hypothetical protein
MGFATSYLLKHRFFKPFIPNHPIGHFTDSGYTLIQ